MTDTQIPSSIRSYLWLNAAVFLAFGAAFVLAPAALAGLVDIELPSTTALVDLRALYGGLPLAVGVFFVLGLRRAHWLEPALFLAVVSSLEVAAARLYGIAVEGTPSSLELAQLALEAGSGLWGVLAYRALRAPAARHEQLA